MNAIDVMLAKPPGTHRAELKEVQPIPGSPKIPEIRAPTELPLRRPDLIAAEQRVIQRQAPFNNLNLMLQAALEGLSICYVWLTLLPSHFNVGLLTPVLHD